MNDEPGLWVGFSIDARPVLAAGRPDAFQPPGPASTWIVWVGIAMPGHWLGSAVIARLINRPLKQLSRGRAQVREGEYDAHRLDERAPHQRDPRGEHRLQPHGATSSPRSSRTAP